MEKKATKLVRSTRYENYYRMGGYKITKYTEEFHNKKIILWMLNQMRDLNEVVHISIDIPNYGGHACLVKRIRAVKDYSKIKINLMNPGDLGPRQISNGKKNAILQIISISRL